MIAYVRYLTVGCFSLIACLCCAQSEPAVLFDRWSTNQSAALVCHIVSSNTSAGGITIQVLKASDDDDAFVLIGLLPGREVRSLLGRGYGAVGVSWWPSSSGDIAIIDHLTGPGANCVYVVRPETARSNDVVWACLYRTPDHTHASADMVVDHVYWTVESLDGQAGVLHLNGVWSYANANRRQQAFMTTGGRFAVPIFYGYTGRNQRAAGVKSPHSIPLK